MSKRIAVVTDSTAGLSDDQCQGYGITVVPLDVIIDGHAGQEGVDVTDAAVMAALRRRRRVTTSRPAPIRFAQTYERLAEEGVEQVVSLHISGKLSGTVSAAMLGARQAPIPVTVVDSGALAMGLGFAALDAAREARRPSSTTQTVASAARSALQHTRVFFLVDTLEYLWRGGRIGAANALLGTALAVKPLLTLRDGQVEPLEKTRTATKSLQRLVYHAAHAIPGAAAGDVGVHVAIHHAGPSSRSRDLAAQLVANIPDIRSLVTLPVGAVIGAHTGPGTLGVVVCPANARQHQQD